MRKLTVIFILVVFIVNCLIPSSYAQTFLLPDQGHMLAPSAAYMPVTMRGIQIHPENPLLFDFILDSGDSSYPVDSDDFRSESHKLVKYFLTSLTIREQDLWVNLSPFEKDRMMTEDFGKTELGRDMLAQDYILKQLTASMIYPERDLGKTFWNKIYTQAREQFGTTDIPVDTFNKVWIVADKARVLERNNAAYVTAAHLKVMLESDYQAVSEGTEASSKGSQDLSRQILREIIIPEIEKEVNEGRNFAPLRQMFYAMILSTWYKAALKDAFLNQVYSNKGKTDGVLVNDLDAKQKIYAQYLEAYRKGAFNYIKEEVDTVSRQVVPRKYFSGGVAPDLGVSLILDRARTATSEDKAQLRGRKMNKVVVGLNRAGSAGKRPNSTHPSIVGNLQKLRRIFLAKAEASRHPGSMFDQGSGGLMERGIDLDKELSDVFHTIAVRWYEVRPGQPSLRFYHYFSAEKVEPMLVKSPSELGIDVHEEDDKSVASLIRQVLARGMENRDLIVTEPEPSSKSGIKSFFAARDSQGAYEVGFLRHFFSPDEASLFAFTVEGLSEDGIQVLLTQLKEAGKGIKKDRKAVSREDYRDVIEMMGSVIRKAEGLKQVRPVIATPEARFPSPIRGFESVGTSRENTILMLRNTSQGVVETEILWEKLPVIDTRIMSDILKDLDTPEIRTQINDAWEKYKDDQKAGYAVFSTLIQTIIVGVLDRYVRYLYKESSTGIRHYQGVRSERSILENIDILPEGIARDEDALLRLFIDYVNNELTTRGFMPSSLLVLPVQGQEETAALFAIRRNDQYHIGVLTTDNRSFLFYSLPSDDQGSAEEFLQSMNDPETLRQFASVLKSEVSSDDVLTLLRRVITALPMRQYIGTIPFDETAAGLAPQTLLKTLPDAGDSRIEYFYAEPFVQGFSLGLAVRVSPGKNGLEFVTLKDKYYAMAADTALQVIEFLDKEWRTEIEALLNEQDPDMDKFGKRLDRIISPVARSILNQVKSENVQAKAEAYSEAVIPGDIMTDVWPQRRLFVIQMNRDVPAFIVAVKPAMDKDLRSAKPLVLVRGSSVSKKALQGIVIDLDRSKTLAQVLKQVGNKKFEELNPLLLGSLKENIIRKIEAGIQHKDEDWGGLADQAQMYGGIDLNALNMDFEVTGEGQRSPLLFDPAMLAEFERGDFSGLEGTILQIVPVQARLF